MKVKKFISDILKEDTNVNIVTSDVLVKLLETKEVFYSNVIDEFKTNSFRIVENMNMGFEKLANAITNISSNHTDHNKELLQKLDVLCSSINKTNAIVGIPTGNTEYIKVFKDELNERKMKFYQAFRSQELSEYYNSLKSGEQKFVQDKFRPKINKNTPEYEKQLKREDAIQNVVREIKLLHARSKDFQSKIKDIDEKVFNKIESLDKENDIKLSIKSCYQESCENEENKSRDLWIKSLEKLKNTYDDEMKKDKDHFLKFESEEDQGNRSESNNRHIRNSKNGYHHNQRGRGRYRHYSRRDYHNRQQK